LHKIYEIGSYKDNGRKKKDDVMTFLLMLVMLLTLSVAQASTDKDINKKGKVSYSGVPVNNAELIVVPPVMTYPAPALLHRRLINRSQK
jgi:hypothetical protein